MQHTKLRSPNCLDYFGVRQLEFLPPNFSTTTLEGYRYVLIQLSIKWITENLKGRFYADTYHSTSSGNKKSYTTFGFELDSELTLFLIACPYSQ